MLGIQEAGVVLRGRLVVIDGGVNRFVPSLSDKQMCTNMICDDQTGRALGRGRGRNSFHTDAMGW